MLYVKAAAKISNHGAAYLHGSEHLEMEIAMSRLPISALALLGLMTLAACDTSSGGSGGIGGMSQSQTVGTGAGAAAGGMAGYLISGGPAGALIGAAAGGLIGNRLGNYLEGDEQQAAAHAAARAAEVPTGERVTWKKSGAYFQTAANGWASPTGAEFRDGKGRTCRHIRQSATKNGNTQEDTITLCKEAAGWVPG
jgi:osmotically inducible lipoprotein OsmB